MNNNIREPNHIIFLAPLICSCSLVSLFFLFVLVLIFLVHSLVPRVCVWCVHLFVLPFLLDVVIVVMMLFLLRLMPSSAGINTNMNII